MPLGAKVRWLRSLVQAGEKAAAGGRFGIFGTSIAGVWLYGQLGARVAFFVDEDPKRVGTQLFGVPIVAPQSAPAGSAVLLAFVPQGAAAQAGQPAAAIRVASGPVFRAASPAAASLARRTPD